MSEVTAPRRRRLALAALIALVVASALGAVAGPAWAQDDGEGADQSTEAARGFLFILVEGEKGGRDEKQPVVDVEITVRSAGGEEVGSATTDAEGRWEVPVPGPGRYEAEIDTESLPEDVELRDEDKQVQPFGLRPGQARTVQFPLGDDPRDVRSTLDEAISLAVAGVNFGLIIAVTAIGLSLIFGTTGLTNFSHGELVAFGSLAAFFLNQTLGIHLIPAALGAMVIGGAFAGALDLGLWRPLRRRRTGLIAMMVISIGVGLLLRYMYLYQFGGRTRPYGDYAIQDRLEFGRLTITPRDIASILISLGVLIAIGLMLQRTKIGKAMRAVSDNPDLAASSGIDVERVILFVWVAGGALAALGGVLLGLAEQVSWQGGFRLLLLMFAGVTLGGLGTAYGALVGSFIIGLFVQMSTLWISPEIKTVPALVVLILILLVRPQGILGRAERIG